MSRRVMHEQNGNDSVSSELAVLMCASNAESTLATAIESILSQTYEEFEFVVVENGSTDRTWEIIKSYEDPRIKAFRTEIRRLPFNLNYGLLQTHAKWVARMDADDIACPQRLERQMAYLQQNPSVEVLGSFFQIFGNGFEERVIEMPTSDVGIRKSLPFFLSICHPTVIMRREKILSVGGYGLTYSEDLDLWLRLSRDKTVQFANLPESLLKYRIHQKQSKGFRESYFSAAAVLYREALVQSSIRCLIGSFTMVAKYYIGNIFGVKKVLTKFGFLKKAF